MTQISLNHDQVRVVHDNPMHVATWLRRPSDSLLFLVMNQCVLRAHTHTHNTQGAFPVDYRHFVLKYAP